jgi:hypothetical protein
MVRVSCGWDRLCVRRLGLGGARLGGGHFRSVLVARADGLLRGARAEQWSGGFATQATAEPAEDPAPAPKHDNREPPAPTPASEALRGQSTGRHRLFEALEDRALGSWLLPMIGLGAARSYDVTGTIGLTAAAAERRASCRRARTFAKHALDETSGGDASPSPTRRRRRATSAWLDPLD